PTVPCSLPHLTLPSFPTRRSSDLPQAIVCADPFHIIKLVGDALDDVRREHWNQLRKLPDDKWAKNFKGARWSSGSLRSWFQCSRDRKSTRLNSSHVEISYAAFCLN